MFDVYSNKKGNHLADGIGGGAQGEERRKEKGEDSKMR